MPRNGIADGLVNVHYDELNQTMIRPVSFDGMLSPLWVQRPPNQSAATGGDAVEALNKDAVRLSAMGPAQAYIVTPEMTKALKQAATEWPVDAYSEDLNKVAKGDDPAVTCWARNKQVSLRKSGARVARLTPRFASRRHRCPLCHRLQWSQPRRQARKTR